MARARATAQRRVQTTNRATAANQSGRYYSPSSEAHDLSWYEDEPKTTKKVRRIVRPRGKIKRGARYRFQLGENIHSIFIYLPLLLIFVGALAVTSSYSTILVKQRNISSLNAELKKVSELTVLLETELSEKIDLAEIERIAIHKLEMGLPDQSQIVYIKPADQFNITHDTSATHETARFSLAMIQNLFFGKD